MTRKNRPNANEKRLLGIKFAKQKRERDSGVPASRTTGSGVENDRKRQQRSCDGEPLCLRCGYFKYNCICDTL